MIELGIVVVWLVLLGLAVEAATELIVDSDFFLGFRDKIFKLANPMAFGFEIPTPGTLRHLPHSLWVFVNKVIKCGYCTSVWFAFAAAIFVPQFIHLWNWIDWLVNWLIYSLVIHRLSNWMHISFMRLKKGRVQTLDVEISNRLPIEVKILKLPQIEIEK